jgi:hypothetical protein
MIQAMNRHAVAYVMIKAFGSGLRGVPGQWRALAA